MPEITYRPLGKSGLLVSTIGLGCNNFGRPKTATASQEGTSAVIDAAIDAGITLFDTADIYGGARGDSETLMGNSLKGKRDQIVLATKFGMDMQGANGPDWGARGSRRYIRIAVESSLRRLQTDWIDLYQLHQSDGVTPMSETLEALDELITEGKVRYIGHSNLSGWQIAEAAHTAREIGAVPFISAQNHWSLLEREVEQEVVPAALHYGLGVLPYFPLANGLLTGKVRRATGIPAGTRLEGRAHLVTDERLDTVERLAAWGEKNGRTLLEIGIGALAGRPGCASVIAGATSPEQIIANAAAAEWIPTAAELAEIDEVLAPASAN
jgi:aryl-alcohol dehydrogenase-like predicted oxidoreductase